MESHIADGNIGSVGKYDVDFKEGKLVIVSEVMHGQSSAGLIVKIDGRQVLDAIAKAIPGQVDDAVIKVLESALLPIA